jgi:hypothetical protein
MKFLSFSLVVSFLVGCKPAINGSQTSAILSDAQLAKAEEILGNSPLMKYGIPFQISKAGCESRALLMSAQLAAEGIPSSAIYVNSDSDHQKFFQLRKNGKLVAGWSYHTTPLFVRESSGKTESFVIDPAVFDGKVTRMNPMEWMEKFDANVPGILSSLLIFPGSCWYQGISFYHRPDCAARFRAFSFKKGEQLQGSLMGGVSQISQGMVKSMDEMPQFWTSELSLACRKLHRWNNQRPNKQEAEAANKHLSESMGIVVAKLRQRGKVHPANPAEDPFEFTCIPRPKEPWEDEPEDMIH